MLIERNSLGIAQGRRGKSAAEAHPNSAPTRCKSPSSKSMQGVTDVTDRPWNAIQDHHAG
jgi:hypothetical protein